jgi:hypothetical protein
MRLGLKSWDIRRWWSSLTRVGQSFVHFLFVCFVDSPAVVVMYVVDISMKVRVIIVRKVANHDVLFLHSLQLYLMLIHSPCCPDRMAEVSVHLWLNLAILVLVSAFR